MALPDELPQELADMGSPSLADRSSEEFPGMLPRARAAAEGSNSQWKVDEDQLARYRAFFEDLLAQTPNPRAGVVGPGQVKGLLEASGLPPAELSQIWQLSDADGDGFLTLAEFVSAMHLATMRRQGLPLPRSLPQELQVSSFTDRRSSSAGKQAAGVSWELTPDELEGYWYVFEGLEMGNAGFVKPDEAWSVFERSELQKADLNHIWQICDIDMDGCLNFGEFACALNIVSRCRKGAPLPPALPDELRQYATRGNPPPQRGAQTSTGAFPGVARGSGAFEGSFGDAGFNMSFGPIGGGGGLVAVS